ncbi:DUF6311 domain-containing protein [Flavobacterium ardleyense]|uniref:DUF6311 domain-containing protein n=1 Tax=Flavobacterium ardleyense TaxID=2038737 RepID=A0ABW5Z6X5_9FLAO
MEKILKMLKNRQGKNIFFSFLIASIVFYVIYGIVSLNPKETDWLMSAYHDWGTHYLGAAFYRLEPWSFPIGDMSNLYYPVSTNVGFTDSIPLLAFLTKLFSGILPQEFQYLGIWLFICTFLLSYYTFKICNLYKLNIFFSFTTVILVVLNPVFIFRGIHPALSSHFLIVASIYYYLIRTNKDSAFKINRYQILILFIASSINPYITVMIFGFNMALPLKHYFFEKTINLKQLLLFPVLSVFSILFFWIIFGMIQFKKSTDLASVDSFNMYSFNLNSFYNSYGHFSKFLPNFGFVNDKQYEGFAYFGLGMLILILISALIITFSKRKIFYIKNMSFLPILIICLLQFLFAITNEVTLNDKVLFKLPLPSLIEKLGFIFRASGRFVWPLYYLIFIFSILIFSKAKLNNSLKTIFFSIILFIQLYDIQHLITFRDLDNAEYNPPINQEKWKKIFNNFEEIITYPPFETSLNYQMDYQDLCLIALKTNKPISNGYVARSNIEDTNNFKEEVTNSINANQLLKERLYVTTLTHLHDFSNLISTKNVTFKRRDNFIFIYDSKHKIDNLFDKQDHKFIDSLKQQFKSINKVTEIKAEIKETNDVKFYFDQFKKHDLKCYIQGWGFIESTKNNSKDSIFIVLSSDLKKYLVSTKMYLRPDISSFFKNDNLNNSGFKITLSNEKFDEGEYSIGILIKQENGSLHFKKSDEKLVIAKEN